MLKLNIGDTVYTNGKRPRRGKVTKVSPTGQYTVAMEGGGTERALPNGRIIGGGYYANIHTDARLGERMVKLGEIDKLMREKRGRLNAIGVALESLWKIAHTRVEHGAEVVKLGEELLSIGHHMWELARERDRLIEEGSRAA